MQRVNPDAEISRHISKYNMVNGRIPSKVNKMFSLWAGEIQRREELLKVTVDSLKKLLLLSCALSEGVGKFRIILFGVPIKWKYY